MKQVLNFSGLNGLRAIAALSVLFSHTTMGLSSFGLSSFVFGKYDNGNPKSTLLAGFGVSIFFSLSGFLITYLLLEEKKTKKINIKHFYFRRILRIWPLYYLYFILSSITLIIFDLPFEKHSIMFYIFLLANIPFIFGGVITFLGHYWSLGVEEQFYSFWPWIVKKSHSILTTTTIICFTIILLKCILRVLDLMYHNGVNSWLYEMLHSIRFQCMLIGAIGAILYYEKKPIFIILTNNLISQFISWLIIFLVAINKFHLISVIDNELISIVTVFLIIGQIQIANRIINLENSLFKFIGKISYGIYVIHPLVIFYLSKLLNFSSNTDISNYVIVYFCVFVTTIIFAYLSYELFEKKFLTLKEKYSSNNKKL